MASGPLDKLLIGKVRLHIEDINDNEPIFPVKNHYFEVSEAAEVGTSFVLPQALDRDSFNNGLAGYRLLPPQEHFELNPSVLPVVTGGEIKPYQLRLTLVKKLDREKENAYYLRVSISFFCGTGCICEDSFLLLL